MKIIIRNQEAGKEYNCSKYIKTCERIIQTDIYEYASIFIIIYAIYEYTYAITISEKRDYKFKGK